MNPDDKVEFGTTTLYCPQCKVSHAIRWYGKLVAKRCWRCDTPLEERASER